ncbi:MULTISPECIES: FbpB family small basic protein [Cytobacillus]|nr:FbpB family small basic protein [Cytobacillus firmus]MCM3707776.1 FbpB family small basic protein [Cytobacillus firmus]
MKKAKISFAELMKKNKEELLRDQATIEKIEKRIDEKYTKVK